MVQIQPGDTWKVAREKINTIMDEVEDNIPSIWDNWNWYLWETDTEVPATWPEWPEWPKWDDWELVTPKEYEDKWESTQSDDIIYMIYSIW